MIKNEVCPLVSMEGGGLGGAGGAAVGIAIGKIAGTSVCGVFAIKLQMAITSEINWALKDCRCK